MPISLTTEQVLGLAPDGSSAKAGQGLAGPRKWPTLGCSEHAAWGECQGSGKTPYKVQIDFSGDLAYRCSCPSRKLPCKHTLGLLLMLVNQPDAFTQGDPPDWVAEWLAKRSQTAQKRAEKRESPGKIVDPKAQAKRLAARETKVRAGLDELERWLGDLTRNGLADAQSRPHSFWEAPAARMVDAQAPGIARLVRNLAGISASGAGWQGRLLEHLGHIHLLIEGFKRLDSLPPDVQSDIRTAIGFTLKEDDLNGEPTVRDQWLVLGQVVEHEDNLRVQRTWLKGQTSDSPALLLSFAAANQPLDRSLIPGMCFDADLVFYPSAFPLRATLRTTHAQPAPLTALPGAATISAATETYASALAANPWLERFPLTLCDATLVHTDGSWFVRDTAQLVLPLTPHFDAGWHLLALSGGHPMTFSGEWDGDYVLPLSVWVEGSFHQC